MSQKQQLKAMAFTLDLCFFFNPCYLPLYPLTIQMKIQANKFLSLTHSFSLSLSLSLSSNICTWMEIELLFHVANLVSLSKDTIELFLCVSVFVCWDSIVGFPLFFIPSFFLPFFLPQNQKILYLYTVANIKYLTKMSTNALSLFSDKKWKYCLDFLHIE